MNIILFFESFKLYCGFNLLTIIVVKRLHALQVYMFIKQNIFEEIALNELSQTR